MIKVQTEHGKYYLINERDEITQLISGKPNLEHSFSGQWKVRGLCLVQAFGHLKLIRDWRSMVGKNLKFKNGRGKYCLADYDHGTNRVWGERIVAIWEDIDDAECRSLVSSVASKIGKYRFNLMVERMKEEGTL